MQIAKPSLLLGY